MGYIFRGFFTTNPVAVVAARELWPFCQVKAVQKQMQGYVVKAPCEYDLLPTASDDELEQVWEQYLNVKETLPAFSKQFRNTVFVYLEADCFGGICFYSGFHAKGGSKVKVFNDCQASPTILREILAPFNVTFQYGYYFEPLTRGYFDKR